MKKTISILCVFVLVFTFSCDNEPLDSALQNGAQNNCESAMINTATAAQNLAGLTPIDYEENYTGVCTALRAAMEAQLIACGDPDGSLQAAIDALGTCDLNADPCELATSAVAVAQQVYNQATDDEYTEACNTYKTVLQQQINECGDADGSIQAIIDGLGDCSIGSGTDVSLDGLWLLTSWNSSEAVDINNDGNPSIDLLSEFDCYNNETMVFNVDNTGVVTNSSYADIVLELVVGSDNEYEYTVDCVLEEEIINMTWTQIDNTVTITDEFGEASEWTLNGNQLSIFVPEGFFVGNADLSVTTSTDLTFIYTKQ